MIYTCAYWANAQSLDTAQEAKLDLVARKWVLERGLRVLDIGCGWGGAAQFIAERQASVTGVTVSQNQAAHGAARCAGLPVTSGCRTTAASPATSTPSIRSDVRARRRA